jgi:hypothetical protein
MDTRMNGHESDVVQLRRASAPANDQLDTAGQTILQMIDRAAGVAEEHSRHALEMAQKFSNELRAAEDRVAELETERSNGFIASVRRSKSDFFGRTTLGEACRKGRKMQGLDRICTNKELQAQWRPQRKEPRQRLPVEVARALPHVAPSGRADLTP